MSFFALAGIYKTCDTPEGMTGFPSAYQGITPGSSLMVRVFTMGTPGILPGNRRACAVSFGASDQDSPCESTSMPDPTQCSYAPPGEYMKDHSFVYHDGWWHLFNISGTAGYYHGYNGNEETVAWSISRDLVEWEFRGHVLHASQWPGFFDQHEIWAPFCMKAPVPVGQALCLPVVEHAADGRVADAAPQVPGAVGGLEDVVVDALLHRAAGGVRVALDLGQVRVITDHPEVAVQHGTELALVAHAGFQCLWSAPASWPCVWYPPAP